MNPMYITFAIYLVAVLLIGLAAYFSTRNFDDYILGGRSLGAFVTAMSAGASDMSGWLLMGLPGAIYLSGLNEAWIAIGILVGAYFNWLLVAETPARAYRIRQQCADAAGLFLPPLRRGRTLDESGFRTDYPVFLHDLLRLGHCGGRNPVPKPV